MKVPIDNEIMKRKFEETESGGCCGQACLAVIENSTIKEVFSNWEKVGLVFKGYSGWNQLRDYLKARGFEIKQERYDENKFFNMEKIFLARVQWLGPNYDKLSKPYYGYNHWSEASAHTHFIVIHDNKVFCNEDGIFDFEELKDYLDGKGNFQSGVITSLLVINPKEAQNAKVSEM